MKRFAATPPRMDTGAGSRTPRVALATVAFNNTRVIALQARLIARFVSDDYQLIVVDNSTQPETRLEIQDVCANLAIRYISLPANEWSNFSPSFSHGCALNWAYANVLAPLGAPIIGFLDHDVFPIRPTSVAGLLQDFPFSGLREERGSVWYLWPGFAVFDVGYLTDKAVDFRPGPAGDTGSRMYQAVYASHIAFKGLKQTYFQMRSGSTDFQESNYAVFGDWLHTFNASYWMKSRSKEDDIERLIKELTEKEEKQARG